MDILILMKINKTTIPFKIKIFTIIIIIKIVKTSNFKTVLEIKYILNYKSKKITNLV